MIEEGVEFDRAMKLLARRDRRKLRNLGLSLGIAPAAAAGPSTGSLGPVIPGLTRHP